MKPMNAFSSLILLFGLLQAPPVQSREHFPEPPAYRSTSQVVDYWVTREEQTLLALAQAMPADKYSFAPNNGEFKGVRTFAAQLKHLSATNYILGAAMLGVAPPADAGDETGPESLRTKEEVVRYLQESFIYLHKAVSSIDDSNRVVANSSISPMPKGTATRLGFAIEDLMHTYNHYGQLVEYLRMNGVVPPASRLDGSGSPAFVSNL
jgi:uncharacterized damage-inducible protein DinB